MNLTNTKYHSYPSEETIRPTVRPLPYFGAYAQSGERELAASLRRDFVPLLARRLPDTPLTFCGRRSAGGYAGVDPAKADAFRVRVDDILRRSRGVPPRALVKRLNAALTAFGHYYKYGSVTRLYAELDVYVRRGLRQQADFPAARCGNGRLQGLGLRSLSDICVAARSRGVAGRHTRPLGAVRCGSGAPRSVSAVGGGRQAHRAGPWAAQVAPDAGAAAGGILTGMEETVPAVRSGGTIR